MGLEAFGETEFSGFPFGSFLIVLCWGVRLWQKSNLGWDWTWTCHGSHENLMVNWRNNVRSTRLMFNGSNRNFFLFLQFSFYSTTDHQLWVLNIILIIWVQNDDDVGRAIHYGVRGCPWWGGIVWVPLVVRAQVCCLRHTWGRAINNYQRFDHWRIMRY